MNDLLNNHRSFESNGELKITGENLVEFIADIFERRGADSYLGESVTMSQHMLQGALQYPPYRAFPFHAALHNQHECHTSFL